MSRPNPAARSGRRLGQPSRHRQNGLCGRGSGVTQHQQLAALHWPGAVERVRWTLLATGELAAPQLTLFDTSPAHRDDLRTLAAKLGNRYGKIFLQGQVTEAGHPLPERRAVFSPLTEDDLAPAAAPDLAGLPAAPRPGRRTR